MILPLLILFTFQEPEIATSIAFTEGPTVDASGNVYFTDTVSQRIMKLEAGGQLTVVREKSNGANGLLIDPQGRLIACEGDRGGIPRVTRTDLKTGVMEVLAADFNGQRFDTPNDVTIDSRGRLYFTDLPGGAVYRIDAPGKVVRLLSRPEIQRPNGIPIPAAPAMACPLIPKVTYTSRRASTGGAAPARLSTPNAACT